MKFINNLNIRAKLIGSFALVAILAGGIGVVAVQELGQVSDNADVMYDKTVVPLATLNAIAQNSQRVRSNLRDMILASDAKTERYYGERVLALTAEIDELAALYEQGIFSQEMRDTFEAWSQARADYVPHRDRMIAFAYAEGQDEAAVAVLNGAGFEAAQAEIAALDALRAMKQRHAEELKSANAAIADGFVTTLLIIFSVLVILALLIGALLARTIGGALRTLADKAQTVTEGEYDIDVGMARTDEIGQLSQSLDTMLVRIRESMAHAEELTANAEHTAQEAQAQREQVVVQQAYLTDRVDTMLGEMRRFADGDLTVRLHADRDDDIGRLYNGFNEAVQNTRRLIEHVQAAAAETQHTSTTIRTETDQLAQAARQQASQSAEISVSIAQMSDTIVDMATNASRTADVAQENGAVAEQGRVVVEETTAKMNEIANMVSQSAETVGRLGESSEAIGEIVQTIQDIADQTNLLALNAAIEAARAGDQGRGFAVVADEVRKLAERTSHATQQIGEMIRPIQHETESAVADMNRGRNEVTEGIRLANEAGDALGRIVEASQRTIELVSQMAVAAEEQSATSEQIARSIDDMTGLIQASSDSAETVAVGIDALATQARGLSDQVATFQVDGDSSRAQTLRRAA
ncbi:MAG: methyl-accepting chemotaxis protein [Bacteroidota bacterium]